MNFLPPETEAKVIATLADGHGIRATARLTGVNRETVAKIKIEIGSDDHAVPDDLRRARHQYRRGIYAFTQGEAFQEDRPTAWRDGWNAVFNAFGALLVSSDDYIPERSTVLDS